MQLVLSSKSSYFFTKLTPQDEVQGISMNRQTNVLRGIVWILPLLLASVGGYSLWFETQGFEEYGLDWDFSSSSAQIPVWIKIAWPVLVFLTAFLAYDSFLALPLYCFASLSVQGSEPAAYCANLDGFLDWFLLSLFTSFCLGKMNDSDVFSVEGVCWRVHFRTLIHPAFIFLSLFVFWVYLSSWLKTGWGFLEAPIHYRRPQLWLHCWCVFFIAASELDRSSKRFSFLLFLVFTLIWRVAVTKDSVFLEGHVASFIVFVLPWTIFAVHRFKMDRIYPIWFGYLFLGLVWYAGPSFDGKQSFLATVLADRYGAIGILSPYILLAFLLFSSTHRRFLWCNFLLAGVLGFTGVLLIANRAAALSAVVCLVLSAVLYPSRIVFRCLTIATSCVLVYLGTLYKPLTGRFQDMAMTGSGKQRLDLWQLALDIFSQNRWLGVGSGQFPSSIPVDTVKVFGPLDVHNTFLEVLCENGIPGLVLFGLFWVSLLITSFASFCESRYSPDSVFPNMRTLSGLLSGTWAHRALWVFFVGYLVVGFFGSRHNVPLVYLLAGVVVSNCIHEKEVR